MDDRPRRQEEHGGLTGAVHLVEHPDPVPLQVALLVGIARPGLLAPYTSPATALTQLTARGVPGPVQARGRHCRLWPGTQGRASNTRLNGVSAARRKRVNPPVAVTSRILASPACAPRARPTSWESEAGVHSRVENP